MSAINNGIQCEIYIIIALFDFNDQIIKKPLKACFNFIVDEKIPYRIILLRKNIFSDISYEVKMANSIWCIREYLGNCQCHSLSHIPFDSKRITVHSFDFIECWNYFFMAFAFDFSGIKYPAIDTIHTNKNHIALFFYSCIDMQNVASSLILDFLYSG